MGRSFWVLLLSSPREPKPAPDPVILATLQALRDDRNTIPVFTALIYNAPRPGTTTHLEANVPPTCLDPVVAASHTDYDVPPSPLTANHASQPLALGVSSSTVSTQNRTQPALGKCLSCVMGTRYGSLPRSPSPIPERMRSLGTLPHSHTSNVSN